MECTLNYVRHDVITHVKLGYNPRYVRSKPTLFYIKSHGTLRYNTRYVTLEPMLGDNPWYVRLEPRLSYNSWYVTLETLLSYNPWYVMIEPSIDKTRRMLCYDITHAAPRPRHDIQGML